MYLYLSRFLRLFIEETLFSSIYSENSNQPLLLKNLSKFQIKIIKEMLESLQQRISEMSNEIEKKIFNLSQAKSSIERHTRTSSKLQNPRAVYTNIKVISNVNLIL